jgi:hypothetical protein
MKKPIGQLILCALTGSAAAFLTSAQAGSFSANFNDNQVPPATALYGNLGDGNAGVISNGVLILTRAVANNNGGFIIEDLDGGSPISGFTATFKLLIGNGSGAAGFSFNFAPDLPDGTINEEGAGSDLRVCFDTYQDSGGDTPAPSIDLKNNGDYTKAGGIVGSVLGIEPVFRQSKFVNVWIQVKSDNTLSMTVDNTVIFTNFYGAFTASQGRFGFGASTGGSLGDNHWLDDIHIETDTSPAVVPAHPLVVTNSPSGGGVPAEPAVHLAIKDFTTQVKTNTVQLLFNGVAVTPVVAKTGDTTTVDYVRVGALAPLSANTYTLIFEDTGAYTTTITYGFTTAQYRSAVLPAPVYFENFDTTDEGNLPAGWTQTNATTVEYDALDLNNITSDSYLGWTVVDRSRFEAGGNLDSRCLYVSVDYLNGVLITNLIDGHCAFAASTGRKGNNNLAAGPPFYNQIQMLFSPDFDLRGKTNIYLAYNSIWTQNQDSLGAVEFSIDQGQTWLPVIYMLDATGTSPGGFDIVTNVLGQVDGEATFTQPRTDTPIVVDSIGLTNRYSFWYEFISARPLSSLGPSVNGRVNDNQYESRRFEVFRLPQADNQAKVRFCFTQVGTSSWWYAIDNFGLYSIPSPTLSIARIADKVTISWGPTNAVGFTLQSATTLANPQWAPVSTGAVSNSVTLTIGANNQFFRLIR